MNNKKHVIITRYEQISAFGCGIQALELAKMDRLFKADEQVAPHYGPTKDYDFFRLTGLSSNQETRQMDPLARITVACAHLVLQQEKNINKEKTGIFLGGGFGCQVSNQSFIDSLIELQKTEMDLDKRNDILRMIDKRLTEIVPYVLLWGADHHRLLYWNQFGTPKNVLDKYNREDVIVTYWWKDSEKENVLTEAKKSDKSLELKSREIHYTE
jgi:hypothetical protein